MAAPLSFGNRAPSLGAFLRAVLDDFVEERGEGADVAIGQCYFCLAGSVRGRR